MNLGYVVGESLPEAYESSLSYLHLYGTETDSEDWGVKCKECQMVMKVKDPLKEPMISMLSIATPESLQKYLMEMLDGLMDWSITYGLEPYTYHDRIMRQYYHAIYELKRSKSSRRAAINVRVIDDCFIQDPACLQWIRFSIEANKLNMTVLFRSNDACRATFMNAFALIMLQRKALVELRETYPELEMGEYTHIADNYHTYADHNGEFSLLENYFYRMVKAEEEDDLDSLRADYVEEWEDMMYEYVDKIVKENDEKRKEYMRC